MKARPILFNAHMVRALLEDRKTNTRRILKPQPEGGLLGVVKERKTYWFKGGEKSSIEVKCPFGQVGDLLWVRETFLISGHEEEYGAHYYRADPLDNSWVLRNHEDYPKWTPSIFMKRLSSRLTLEIIDIRVEQLQDISEDDALAEGIVQYEGIVDIRCYGGSPVEIKGVRYGINEGDYECPIKAYAELWKSINGKDSWDADPWVWVIEFKVHKSNIDSFLEAKTL
ncbi:MAG: hypothetical protein V4721_00390 [Bacteroidota bacterium]